MLKINTMINLTCEPHSFFWMISRPSMGCIVWIKMIADTEKKDKVVSPINKDFLISGNSTFRIPLKYLRIRARVFHEALDSIHQ